MGFRINTNIAALNAHTSATMNNRSLDNSLSRLSSGLRINTAADDASGMAIADSLRSQANSLGQAVSNANDAIGLIQTADKAMDEQLKILDTIKTKAIQAASDSQNTVSRAAIQKDVNRLIEQLDNIAKTTSFNGQVLLSGKFSNKEFQIGAYSNQTVTASVNNTQSVAIGSIQTRDDIAQVGNYVSHTVSAGSGLVKGATTIVLSVGNGLAIGDTIRIDGVGEYKVTSFSGAVASTGAAVFNVSLDKGLEKGISVGGTVNVSIVNEATETNLSAIDGSVLTVADLTGWGVGDQITVVNSAGVSETKTIASISTGASTAATLSGTLTLDSAFTITAAAPLSITVVKRGSLGSEYATSDYAQYTVEGTELTGVQMTNSAGYGVAGSGLGKIADLINESTVQTGVKAVATVEKDSLIRVQGMTLTEDIMINGEKVMEAGQSVVSGDSNNALVTSINEKSNYTGVKASLDSDGTLTLTSDGRAMKLDGLSAVAGISDGVYGGTMSLTKNGLAVMDVTSAHYTDAALTTAASAKGLTEVVDTFKLQDLVFGQVDDNKDGTIDSNDKLGFLNSKEGAMKAMDIVEAAITELDTTRADLGSVQNQLVVTVNNISVTQVNVKSAESAIRDVDFAAESANFSKFNILAQSGSYAMSQANAVQQNVLRLLQ